MGENFFLERLKVMSVLLWAFFSAYYSFVAPQELMRVAKVHKYQQVQVYLDKIAYQTIQPANRKIVSAIRIYDASTNKLIIIRDLAPGDFGNAAIMAAIDKNAVNTNRLHENTQILVYRSNDKAQYYLAKGSFLPFCVVLALAATFWVFAISKLIIALKAQK